MCNIVFKQQTCYEKNCSHNFDFETKYFIFVLNVAEIQERNLLHPCKKARALVRRTGTI